MPGIRPKPETLIDEPLPERPAGRVLPPFQVMRAASENTRIMHATLKEVLVRKNWVFAAMGLAFCVSAAWYWTHPLLYSSTVSFYVLAPPVVDKDEPIYLSVQTDQPTLKNIATSTAMFDHLIDVFGLHEHYDVPPGSPNERAKLHAMLEERVNVDMRESDIVAVGVRDHDPEVAAAMANEVFNAARSMVQVEQQAELARQIHMYQQVIDSTDRFARNRAAELIRLADELRAARGSEGDRLQWQERSVELAQGLMDVANDVAGSNRELVRQRRNHANLLVMASSTDAGTIRLKTRAMEDIDTSPVEGAIQAVLLITLITGAVAALLLLLIIETWLTPAPQPLPVRR
jgi:capsular polysaccharide biosynthesis protein